MLRTLNIHYLIIGILLFGCGHSVKEKLHVIDTGSLNSCDLQKKVVVLPIIDYTFDDDSTSSERSKYGVMEEDLSTPLFRSTAVMESLIDNLTAKGFTLPVPDDTTKYLVQNNIIVPIDSSEHNSSHISSIENELRSGEWSKQMRRELKREINLQGQATQKRTQGLDKDQIIAIGKHFQADYIIRGRILKYDLQQDESWNPLRRGLMPLIFPDAPNRLFVGIANPEMYDIMDGLLADNATRGVVGNAVFHLRLWVQDSSTGEVIWTNRAEVTVTQQTSFAERNVDNLFHMAVNRAVTALIDDFWVKTETYIH